MLHIQITLRAPSLVSNISITKTYHGTSDCALKPNNYGEATKEIGEGKDD